MTQEEYTTVIRKVLEGEYTLRGCPMPFPDRVMLRLAMNTFYLMYFYPKDSVNINYVYHTLVGINCDQQSYNEIKFFLDIIMKLSEDKCYNISRFIRLDVPGIYLFQPVNGKLSYHLDHDVAVQILKQNLYRKILSHDAPLSKYYLGALEIYVKAAMNIFYYKFYAGGKKRSAKDIFFMVTDREMTAKDERILRPMLRTMAELNGDIHLHFGTNICGISEPVVAKVAVYGYSYEPNGDFILDRLNWTFTDPGEQEELNNKPKKRNESIGEENVREYLTKKRIPFVQEYSLHDKNYFKSYARIDFYIPDSKTFIEFQGEQHYKSVSMPDGKKTDIARQKRRDKALRKYCADKQFQLIEVPYQVRDDVASFLDSYF